MGFLVDSGTKLYRNWFKEMCFLLGFEVEYQFVREYKETDFAEFEVYSKYSKPIKTNIVFERNPTVKTLKTLGWFSQDSDEKPYIAFLAFDIPHLTVGAKLIIPPFEELGSSNNEFIVEEITTNLQFPDCWVVKLAPSFKQKQESQEVTEVTEQIQDSNFNFLKPKLKHNDQINAIEPPERTM